MAGKGFWEGIGPMGRTIVGVSAFAVAVGIGVAVYFSIKKRISLAGSFAEKRQIDNAIEDLAKKNIKPTWSKSTYLLAANQIFTALDGAATDENVIERIFERMKNDADILSLMEAYGIREVKSGLPLVNNFKGTMAGAIADEFDEFEVKSLNKILTKNGVTILF